MQWRAVTVLWGEYLHDWGFILSVFRIHLDLDVHWLLLLLFCPKGGMGYINNVFDIFIYWDWPSSGWCGMYSLVSTGMVAPRTVWSSDNKFVQSLVKWTLRGITGWERWMHQFPLQSLLWRDIYFCPCCDTCNENKFNRTNIDETELNLTESQKQKGKRDRICGI